MTNATHIQKWLFLSRKDDKRYTHPKVIISFYEGWHTGIIRIDHICAHVVTYISNNVRMREQTHTGKRMRTHVPTHTNVRADMLSLKKKCYSYKAEKSLQVS